MSVTGLSDGCVAEHSPTRGGCSMQPFQLSAVPVVHLKHSLDGYPLCWPMDRDGVFEGTTDESVVDCSDCLTEMEEA